CRCRTRRRAAAAWQRVQGPACTQRPRAHAARPYRRGGPIMNLTIRAIGAPLDRIDGPKKVAGAAPYAYEHPVEGVTYAFPVQSTIARGRIASIDASAARALPGVVSVLSHENAPRLASPSTAEQAVFQSDTIAYHGQFIAVVVAETLEIARQAAGLVVVRYEEQLHDVELRADHADLYKPEKVNPSYETDHV